MDARRLTVYGSPAQAAEHVIGEIYAGPGMHTDWRLVSLTPRGKRVRFVFEAVHRECPFMRHVPLAVSA